MKLELSVKEQTIWDAMEARGERSMAEVYHETGISPGTYYEARKKMKGVSPVSKLKRKYKERVKGVVMETFEVPPVVRSSHLVAIVGSAQSIREFVEGML